MCISAYHFEVEYYCVSLLVLVLLCVATYVYIIEYNFMKIARFLSINVYISLCEYYCVSLITGVICVSFLAWVHLCVTSCVSNVVYHSNGEYLCNHFMHEYHCASLVAWVLYMKLLNGKGVALIAAILRLFSVDIHDCLH